MTIPALDKIYTEVFGISMTEARSLGICASCRCAIKPSQDQLCKPCRVHADEGMEPLDDIC